MNTAWPTSAGIAADLSCRGGAPRRKKTMSLELLRAIARSELPVSFTDAVAIEGLRRLKASGYVIGLTSEPGSDSPHGKVSIITHKGWVAAYARPGSTANPRPPRKP